MFQIVISPVRPSMQFRIGPVSNRALPVPRRKATLMLLLTDIQKAVLSVSPKSAAGNPAPVENVEWKVSDPTIATITPDPANPLSAVLTTTGALGSCQVSVSADADLGEGVKTIAGTLDVEVRASEAVSLDIGAGAPETRLPEGGEGGPDE